MMHKPGKPMENREVKEVVLLLLLKTWGYRSDP